MTAIDYYQAWFSAENEADARKILEGLTEKNLIVGGSLVNAPSHFWWKGERKNLNSYCYVMAFTTSDHRTSIEAEYSKLSTEEIPMVSFIKMEGNQPFLAYIYENTHKLL